ncbi:MAG: hypothetical protein JXM70_01265 [Pirellulales bacterium]|nr:hypothetical protein [Pirellulales bacterium]
MKRLYLIWQRLTTLALFATFWLGMHADALAAKLPKKEASSGEGSQSWVAPYALVMLAIGLGMLFVCRSSRRSDRAKPQEYHSVTKQT